VGGKTGTASGDNGRYSKNHRLISLVRSRWRRCHLLLVMMDDPQPTPAPARRLLDGMPF
jgi:hypothetical protein